MNIVNKPLLFQVNFPKSQAGKLADVYYTVYTNAGAIYLSRRKDNVIEFGNGSYGIQLTFSAEGSWSILWDIDSNPSYVAGEEINVYGEGADVFSGYGAGIERYDSLTDQTTSLAFQFLKNGGNFEPYSFDKIEIYSSQADAIAGTNIIETITSFSSVSTGLQSYTVAILSSAGTYFDKIYITPIQGYPQFTQISSFYVGLAQQGLPPGPHEKARVFLNLIDIIGNPQEGDRVVVRMATKYAWYGNDFVESEEEEFLANADGQVLGQDGSIGMVLLETDTLNEDTFPDGDNEIYYIFNILDKKHYFKKIPKGTTQIDFKDLPDVEGVG